MPYNVPNVAGVPALLGGFAASAASVVSTAIVDISSSLPMSMGAQWGIFLNGAPVVSADSVISIDARQDYVIADYPIEGGSFESYDKVQRPFDVRFRFSAGGSALERAALIASVKAIVGDLNLYTFISPEDIFQSVTIEHYDYHRSAESGVGLVVIDVWGWQVQVSQSAGLSNTANPSGADATVNGSTQTTTPSTTAHLQVYDAPSLNTAYSP